MAVRGSYGWVSPVVYEQIAARVRAGDRTPEIVAAFGFGRMTVYRIRDELVLKGRRVAHSALRVSFEERERISRGIAVGETDAQIARAIGRHRCTIGREISRGGGRVGYRAIAAERRALQRGCRPKPGKLSGCPRLLAAVESGLEQRWSPAQISARLKADHPDDEVMRISHETIYQSLYVQSRGELRRQLTKSLRSGRSTRRAQGRQDGRGRIADMVMISERPAEVEDRAVPGHWEGDLILGTSGKSAVATLVERQTRYVMLCHLGKDRTTQTVIEALKERVRDLPAHLKLSLTWDQGKELSAHRQFTVATGVTVYFCDPHSPWQRGSNENTNGLLRQYLPKNSDLAAHDQQQLDRIAAELNGRPRQTLGWANPAEKMLELLTSTA